MAIFPNASAQVANATAQQHAQAAQQHASDAQDSAQQAQVAAAQATAAQPSKPNWIYGMVILFLGLALLTLVIALVIAATNGKTVDTVVTSAVSLIAGGLIGVLAPSPQPSKQ